MSARDDWLRRLLAEATPGPWRVGYLAEPKWWPDAHYISSADGRQSVCGNYDDEDGGVVNWRDAALIAKSPEIAEWAAQARDAMHDYLAYDHQGRSLAECRNGMRALLARYEKIGGHQ